MVAVLRILLPAVLWLGTLASAGPIELFVAPGGNDKWSGLAPARNAAGTDGPLATLERARDLVREARKRGAGPGATVWVRGGTYYLSRTLALTDADSGADGAPAVFRAYRDEKPVLSGGRPVSGFKPYRGQIMQADLSAQGLGGRQIRQLFFQGQRQTLARYPNADPTRPVSGGWAYIDGVVVPVPAPRAEDSKTSLALRAEDARDWTSVEGGEVFIFPRYNFWNFVLPIVSFDRGARTLTLGPGSPWALRPGDRFFVQNLLAELDAPGEWYFDRKSSTLYFWPPGPLESATVTVSSLDAVITMDGARYVQLRGFQIEANDASAIYVKDSSECLIAGNTIRNSGGRATPADYAIAIIGGKHNGVVGNDIFEVGSGGILLRGGEQRSLTPGGHYAENNHIYRTGVFYKQGVGIALDGVGNRASRNLVHDEPRMAIHVSGNDHLVELNRIHDVNLETEDTGAIYVLGRDWLNGRGTVIRNNLVVDSAGFGFYQGRWRTPYLAYGIYLDDNAGSVDVIGNIVQRASWAAVYLHNARDSVVENNLLLDAGFRQIQLWSFGATNPFLADMSQKYREYSALPAWKKYRGFAGVPPENAVQMANNSFTRNVVAYGGAQTAYVLHQGMPFAGTRFGSNVIFDRDGAVRVVEVGTSRPLGWNEWQAKGMDRDSIQADPRITSTVDGVPVLAADSPAFRLGFQPIPVERIGPYSSEDRASWPVVEPPAIREHLN